MQNQTIKTIRVLVVDDSPTLLEYTKTILNDHPRLNVVGTANNGVDAIETTKKLQPDVIVMDINMPKMNGFEATRTIMERFPTPIVIMSGTWDTTEVTTSFLAIEAGALAVLPRPVNMHDMAFETSYKQLIETVITISEVKVVRRKQKQIQSTLNHETQISEFTQDVNSIRAIVIGASTGGPLVIKSILSSLPSNFSFPIIIVQHISLGFIKGFIDWLGQTTRLKVKLLQDGMILHPSQIYVCPDNMEISGIHSNRRSFQFSPISNTSTVNIDNVFRHVLDMYGANSIGILLTGMGREGAIGLKAMRDFGAVTIAQDESSSVIYGMPKEAKNIGAATHVYSSKEIVQFLTAIIEKQNKL